MCLAVVQRIAVTHAPRSSCRVVIDASNSQLIAQRADDGLRERSDGLSIGDQCNTTQGQALDTIGRTEGKNTALGQGCCIGITAICQRGFIERQLSPFHLQTSQFDRFINRRDSDGQSGLDGIYTIGDGVADGGNGTIIIGSRRELIATIRIDQQSTDPCQADRCTQGGIGNPTPAKSRHGSRLRTIIVDGVGKQIARYGYIFRHHHTLSLICEIIDGSDRQLQGGLHRVGAISHGIYHWWNGAIVVGGRCECEAAIRIDDERADPIDGHAGTGSYIGIVPPGEDQY